MSPHQLYIHLAWPTRERRPMIDSPTRDFLDDYFRRTAAREHADVVALAILRTHVHMLLRTVPRIDLPRSEEHTSELQSPCNLVCRLLLEKKKKKQLHRNTTIRFDVLSPIGHRTLTLL